MPLKLCQRNLAIFLSFLSIFVAISPVAQSSASDYYPFEFSTGTGTTSVADVPPLSTELMGGAILNERVEPNNPVVHDEALRIASQYPGDYSIDQICAIFEYLKNNWHYVEDPDPTANFNYASETINRGKSAGYSGVGDCDDFACVMASMIEAIGGSARIIGACDENLVCHAYAEVYVGKDDSDRQSVFDQLAHKYGAGHPFEMFFHRNPALDDCWLNLDWWADHPGGSFYESPRRIMMMWQSDHPLRLPNLGESQQSAPTQTQQSTTPQEVIISGTVFEDLNGNGAKDSDESGLPGWILTLSLAPRGPQDGITATTDVDGKYTFSNIKKDDYLLYLNPKEGWKDPFEGGIAMTSALSSSGEPIDLPVTKA